MPGRAPEDAGAEEAELGVDPLALIQEMMAAMRALDGGDDADAAAERARVDAMLARARSEREEALLLADRLLRGDDAPTLDTSAAIQRRARIRTARSAESAHA